MRNGRRKETKGGKGNESILSVIVNIVPVWHIDSAFRVGARLGVWFTELLSEVSTAEIDGVATAAMA